MDDESAQPQHDSLFAWLVMLLLPEACYVEFFENFNFLDVPCLKIAVSKGLGLGIILGSMLVKFPQIIKIVMSRSGEGISIASVTLELVAISNTWAYSVANDFPFSSWGEASFLAVQTSTIAFLCLMFAGMTGLGLGYLALYVGVMYYLLSGMAPMNLIVFLQASNFPLVVGAKLIQIWTNFKNGHTGQLSMITVFLLFAGSLARVFTTLQETGDMVTMWLYVIATTMNGLVFFQVLYYGKATQEYLEKEKNKKSL